MSIAGYFRHFNLILFGGASLRKVLSNAVVDLEVFEILNMKTRSGARMSNDSKSPSSKRVPALGVKARPLFDQGDAGRPSFPPGCIVGCCILNLQPTDCWTTPLQESMTSAVVTDHPCD